MYVKVYEQIPEGFQPKLEVAACYLEHEGNLLLVQRAEPKSEYGFWGVPAGKVEAGESARDAAQRELWEETGIDGTLAHFQPLGCLYIRKIGIDYIYHLFSLPVKEKMAIRLSAESSAFCWASAEDLAALPLMAGAESALRFYRKRMAAI